MGRRRRKRRFVARRLRSNYGDRIAQETDARSILFLASPWLFPRLVYRRGDTEVECRRRVEKSRKRNKPAEEETPLGTNEGHCANGMNV